MKYRSPTLAFTNASNGASPTPWKKRAAAREEYALFAERLLRLLAPPHAEDMMMINVPSKYRCLFPNTLALGTKKKPATPTPSKCHPVSRAMSVRLLPKYKSNVNVLAASSGDSVDAITESRLRTLTIRSRRHSGQLSGS